FRLAYVSPESRVVGAGDLVDHPKKIALNYLKGYFFIDLFVVLPLPQIMISFVLRKYLGISGANFAKNLLRAAILLQYFPRLFRNTNFWIIVTVLDFIPLPQPPMRRHPSTQLLLPVCPLSTSHLRNHCRATVVMTSGSRAIVVNHACIYLSQTMVPIDIQGHHFTLDQFALPLNGDLVLGVQWLKELGPITMDYNIITMSFSHLGHPVTLQVDVPLQANFSFNTTI
ncbi:putative cyclic nucleotide-gated ion channel 20, chloroplastic, partial [Glycine soja]